MDYSTTRGLAAFELTWQKLDVKTQQVAELLSLFAPDVIPWRLVQSIFEKLNWNKSNIKKAKKQLYKHYLVQNLEDKESSYKIHSLIRQFLQIKLGLSLSALEFKRAFATEMLSIAKQIPNIHTVLDIEKVKDAIPHLEEVVENLIHVVEDEDEGSDSNDKELQELEIERKGMKMGSNEETVGKPGKKKMSKGIFYTDWRGGMQTYINPAKIEGNGDGAEASKASVTVNTRSKRVRIFIEVLCADEGASDRPEVKIRIFPR